MFSTLFLFSMPGDIFFVAFLTNGPGSKFL
jgi:hypothetical protein